MKKLALMFFISIMFFSCAKDYLIPNKEVPDWLKTKISQDEQEMKDFPQSWKYYGAWVRYNWQNEYYFEYHNVLSESLPKPISAKGDTLHFYVFETTTDYYKEKCCKEFVWKAPEFKDLPGM
ncbi:MAG TPA: hypothetical protein VIK14_12350 [Ignavibacteria bacterium]